MGYVSETEQPQRSILKRLAPILFLAAIPVVAVMLIFASHALYAPDQAALSAYLRYYAQNVPGATVKASVQASQPAQFNASMSGRVFGDSATFQTDLPVTGRTNGGPTLKPVPYPPEQLSCVLLGSSQGQAVVFVALHRSGSVAEWLVHEAQAPWPSDALNAQLAAVGCQLTATP
jgi:hypothetical protein